MVEFEGSEIAFDNLQRFDLDLACNNHSYSQGSEYPGDNSDCFAHAHMLSRNLSIQL